MRSPIPRRRWRVRNFCFYFHARNGFNIATAATAADTKYAPGVTDTEIKIGQSAAYSGPAAVVGTMTRAHADYFKMINEHGGVNGRKLALIRDVADDTWP